MMIKTLRLFLALIERIHKPSAFRLTALLISFPQTLPKTERDKAYLAEAKRLEFSGKRKRSDGSKRVALSWGEGPLVILIHGWEGRSTQMTIIAKRLASLGFQAVALDIKAHGESDGRKVTFKDYIDDIEGLIGFLGKDIHAMVGHSAGGLCMMAAREILDIQANQFVTISSPSAPFPLIEAVRNRLKVSESVLDMIKANVARNFNCDWEELIGGKAYLQRRNDEKLLMIFDKDDELVSHDQSDVIHKVWPQAVAYKSEGLGHFKPLWNDEVVDQVTQFISAPR